MPDIFIFEQFHRHLLVKAFKSVPALNILSLSISLVYCFFGLLKFFPSLSPAEDLAIRTIDMLSLGMIPERISIVLLAAMETGIGLMLILGWKRKAAIYLALGHMVCTFTPLFFFPDLAFAQPTYFPSLLGQYIGKNIIIVAALITLLRQEGEQKLVFDEE